MKILLVEDEPKVAAFIKQGLEEQRFEISLATDGLIGKKLALENAYDVMILDLMIPKMSGLELCREIRANGIHTPILMLTALGTVDDKVIGLEAGADDYLVKPFEFKELIARLKALTKRQERQEVSNEGSNLRVADMELDINLKAAKRGGKIIDLTAKEYLLLAYLIRNKNRVISRTEIADKVWDIHFDTGTNVIDVYVNFLRKKIDKDFEKKLIHTVVGMGYMIKDMENG